MRSLAGVGVLARSIVRRDRGRIVVAVVALAGLVYASAASVSDLYPTAEDLASYAALLEGNALMVVQSGPGYGLDDPTVGAVVVNELANWTFIAVALVSVFAIARTTRAEEESGRLELIRSNPVGHRAPLVAAMVVTTATNALLGTAVAVASVASGLPVVGSVSFGVAVAACGTVFAALTTLGAQLTSHARGAIAIGAAGVAFAFIARAVGDVGDGRLSWLSPFGWGHRLRPFADEQWWPLLLSLGGAAVLTGLAMVIAMRRDYGAGLIESRPGPATASAALSGPAGLVWRTQRASVLGWTIGLVVVGLFYGAVADQAEQMVADTPELEEYFVQGGGSITDGYLSTAVLMVALVVGAFAVSSTLRLRAGEQAGHAESVLAAPVSRWRWAGSHLVVTALASVALLGVGGATTGLGYVLAGADIGEISRLTGAALVHVAAVLVLGGATVLLVGVRPGAATAAWALVAAVVVVALLGEVLGLPEAVRWLSPMEHSPLLPAEELTVVPLVVLTSVAIVVTGSGLAAFRRRDVS